MIKSMTAYARKEATFDWGQAAWEIRSVNHRYLEQIYRLSDAFRELEPLCRSALQSRLGRGKVEILLRVKLERRATESLQVNMDLAEDLNQVIQQVNRLLDNPAHINAVEILNWPGVLESSDPDTEPMHEDLMGLYEEALDDLVATRQKEGARLKPLIEERLDSIDRIVEQVRDRMPAIIERQNEALRSRFEELALEVDPQRLEQELVIVAQKADVAEELDRLEAHCREVRDVMERSDPIGRRLDFLMQELNREANTLGSKSLAAETSQLAVDLKVLIEQMREQIQNLE